MSRTAMLSISHAPACPALRCFRSTPVQRPIYQRRPLRTVTIRARKHDYSQDRSDTQTLQDLNVAESAPEYGQQEVPQHYQQYQQQYGVPQYPGPPPQYQQRSSGGGLPSLLWVAIGIGIATVFSKIYGVVSAPGGVQGWMMQQAMKQAMKGMSGPQGGQAPNPFGAGGFPGMPPNMGQGYPPPVDTTAGPSGATASQYGPGPSQDVSKGQRFQQHKAQQQAKQAAAADASSKPPQAAPMSSSGPSSTPFVSPPKKAASFTDVGSEEEAEASASSNAGPGPSSGNGASQNFFNDSQSPGAQQQQASSSQTGSTGKGKGMLEMMEKMMKDPATQQALFPYLPEGMRNAQTFEWMLSNPATRAQLETLLEEQMQGGSFDPQMMEHLQNMPGQSAESITDQLGQMGLTPEDVVQKILRDPELAQAFSKPDVQQAVMDVSTNPMNIMKYKENTEVMRVMNKLSELFPQPGPGMPGMPGAPGGYTDVSSQ